MLEQHRFRSSRIPIPSNEPYAHQGSLSRANGSSTAAAGKLFLRDIKSDQPGTFISIFRNTLYFTAFMNIPETGWTLIHRVKILPTVKYMLLAFFHTDAAVHPAVRGALSLRAYRHFAGTQAGGQHPAASRRAEQKRQCRRQHHGTQGQFPLPDSTESGVPIRNSAVYSTRLKNKRSTPVIGCGRSCLHPTKHSGAETGQFLAQTPVLLQQPAIFRIELTVFGGKLPPLGAFLFQLLQQQRALATTAS